MNEPDFPPNSNASKSPAKNIQRVTSGEPTRRKKSLRKQFTETFIAGDARSSVRYVVLDIMIPAARDMVLDSGLGFLEKLMVGESRRRGSTPPLSGATGYVDYRRVGGGIASAMGNRFVGPQRVANRQSRLAHNFDDIVIESRAEAEMVIDQLMEVVSRYGSATVADLYELVGLPTNHTDNRWGWTNLLGAGVTRIRNGFLLDLPDPHPID